MKTRHLLALVLLTGLSAPSAAADAQLAAFVDGVMEAQLAAKHTVGATVAIVQDGAVLHSAGYGYANVAQQRGVDPEQTLFRVGSISKVLVWMAVLQQVERAGATLDEPVANYLEQVTLDERYAAPVTLRHLMTHSPGFEDRMYGIFGDSTAVLLPLVDYLQRNVPEQLYLPGTVTAYSNYGTALAARVVENLVGSEYADYAQQAIMQPLGMSSTLSQTPGESWQDHLSQGYVFEGGQPRLQPFEYVVPVPAGALSASAADIAKLMNELLNPNSSSVLSSDAKALLLNRASARQPELNGQTLGLFEMTLGNGVRSVGHDGATMLFHSQMILWPSQKLGLFISANTNTGRTAIEHLLTAFTERYGLAEPVVAPPAPAVVGLGRIAGHYGSTRREHSGRMKLLQLLTQVGVASISNDERLQIRDRSFVPYAEGLFQEVNGYNRLAFVPGVNGPDRLTFSREPGAQYQRVPWYERNDLTALFIALVVIANLIMLVRLPYTAFGRRSLAVAGESGRSGAGFTGPVAWLLALTILITLTLYALLVADPVAFVISEFPALQQLAWLWIPIVLGALLMVALALMAWIRGRWWPARRLFYTLVAALNLAFAWWMFYWNLQPLTPTVM